MNYKHITTLIVIISNCISTFGQSEQIDKIIAESTQGLNEEQIESQNLDQFINNLYFYYENPVSINNASTEDLASLNLLSDFQIYSLLEHRKAHGKFFSIYEIPTVIGFNVETAKKIEPFLTFEENAIKGQSKKEINGLYLIRTGKKFNSFQSLSGFNELTDWKLYSRLNMTINQNIGINITAENDPGETIFNDTLPKGPDFTSASISYTNEAWLKNIVLGDFNVHINQGLGLWTGYGSYKGSDPMAVSKKNRTITKYTSTNETNFLRGIAVNIEHKALNSVYFYSYKHIDAKLIDPDSTGKNLYFTSLNATGNHRSKNDLDKRKQLLEQVIGTSHTINYHDLNVNLNVNYVSYEYPFKREEKLYLANEKNTSEWFNMGVGYDFRKTNFHVYGEGVFQPTSATLAILSGIDFHFSSELSSAILYRNYPSGYYAPYAKGFGEYSGTTNEEGVYTAVTFMPSSVWQFTGFADQFKSHWLRYNSSIPVNGKEYGLKIAYCNYDFLISGQLKYTGKYKNRPLRIESSSKVSRLIFTEQSSIRFHMKFKITDNLAYQTRLEMKNYLHESALPGYLIYSSIHFSPIEKSSFNLRYTYYNSKDFDSRIYTYENDVLYSMSIPAFFGKGYKLTFNTKIKITPQLNCWIKYGFQKEYEPTMSHKFLYNKHEVKLQAGYRF